MELCKLRAELDQIDRELLKLFLRRMELSCAVAEYKAANALPTLDPAREKEKLAVLSAGAGEYGEYARRLFETILALSRQRQDEMREEL